MLFLASFLPYLSCPICRSWSPVISETELLWINNYIRYVRTCTNKWYVLQTYAHTHARTRTRTHTHTHTHMHIRTRMPAHT